MIERSEFVFQISRFYFSIYLKRGLFSKRADRRMNHRFLNSYRMEAGIKGLRPILFRFFLFCRIFYVLVEYTIYETSLDIAHRALFRLNEG